MHPLSIGRQSKNRGQIAVSSCVVNTRKYVIFVKTTCACKTNFTLGIWLEKTFSETCENYYLTLPHPPPPPWSQYVNIKVPLPAMITESACQIVFWLNKKLSAHTVQVMQNVGRTIPIGAYMCVVFMIIFFFPCLGQDCPLTLYKHHFMRVF